MIRNEKSSFKILSNDFTKKGWWLQSEPDEFGNELQPYIKKGIYFIERTNKTDFSKFAEELGYQLSSGVGDYINLFWHPYIMGFYKLEECIILFSVVKFDNESDDVLFHENEVIKLAKE